MMKLYSVTGRLKPTSPFDFDKSLDFLGEFPPMQGEQSLAPCTLTKTISLQGKPVVFQLTATGTPNAPSLQYTLYAAQPIKAELEQKAQDRIRFFLSLDDDLRSFYARGLKDEAFVPIIGRLYGLHQVKFLTPFENAVWAVLAIRVPMAVAKKMKQALIEKFGQTLQGNGMRYWAFPEPTQFAGASIGDLHGLIHNERKAEYLHAVISAFAEVDEEWLRHGDYDEVQQWLLHIKGIGEWSAHFVMLRGLGRMDRLEIARGSIHEKVMAEAVAKAYAPGQTIDRTEILRLAERYGAWQGYWAYYLRVAA